MKSILITSLVISVGLLSYVILSKAERIDIRENQTNNRITELNEYWASLAQTAAEGDFEGMKAMYHQDAVVVKTDTTFAVSEAFRVRWKNEILEVNRGLRINTLDFRFSKRIGDETTAFEQGIFHYTSKESATGKFLADSYVHFETLLVKVNNRWVALMEYQQEAAGLEEWESLK